MWTIRLMAVLFLWISFSANAQTTDVTSCTANHKYLLNGLGQNPCLVVAYLENECAAQGGNWNVGALGPGLTYTGPFVDDANYCQCSTVVYSLTSACAACQSSLWIGWSTWSTNCTADVTTIGRWPLDIPSGTAVPDWAYQNVTTHDTWNVTLAQLDKAPQSTYFGTPTASINPHSTSATSTATAIVIGPNVSTAPSQASENPDSSSKTPVGAIVGGVIGGLVVLGLLALLLFLIFRHKNRTAISEMPLVGKPSDMGDADRGLPAGYGVSYPSPTGGLSPQRLYDPADPSTFPNRGETPASFGVLSDSTAHSHSAPTATSYPTTIPTITSSGRYTGAAEV